MSDESYREPESDSEPVTAAEAEKAAKQKNDDKESSIANSSSTAGKIEGWNSNSRHNELWQEFTFDPRYAPEDRKKVACLHCIKSFERYCTLSDEEKQHYRGVTSKEGIKLVRRRSSRDAAVHLRVCNGDGVTQSMREYYKNIRQACRWNESHIFQCSPDYASESRSLAAAEAVEVAKQRKEDRKENTNSNTGSCVGNIEGGLKKNTLHGELWQEYTNDPKYAPQNSLPVRMACLHCIKSFERYCTLSDEDKQYYQGVTNKDDIKLVRKTSSRDAACHLKACNGDGVTQSMREYYKKIRDASTSFNFQRSPDNVIVNNSTRKDNNITTGKDKNTLELLEELYDLLFGEAPENGKSPFVYMGKIFESIGRTPSTRGLHNQVREAADILCISKEKPTGQTSRKRNNYSGGKAATEAAAYPAPGMNGDGSRADDNSKSGVGGTASRLLHQLQTVTPTINACGETPSKSTATSPPQQEAAPNGTENATEPNKNDVLCEAEGGIATRSHVGNIQYCQFVAEAKRDYQSANYSGKILIATALVEQISKLDPPGRFLEQYSPFGNWYQMRDLKAFQKVGQDLLAVAATKTQIAESTMPTRKIQKRKHGQID